MASHASYRTTKPCYRTSDQIILDEVEKTVISRAVSQSIR
jgi:hypothetical protein